MAATTNTPPWREKKGALEHTTYKMRFATLNVGLGNKAIKGSKWEKDHRPKLLKVFTDLVRGKEGKKADGLFLCEVGNYYDLFSDTSVAKMNDLITEAFEKAGAIEHGPPQIFWSDNETCAAFQHQIDVTYHGKKNGLVRHKEAAWRCVEQFLIVVPPEREKKTWLL